MAVLVLLCSASFGLKSQTTDALGAYTPYSLFGLGEMERLGTAYNASMGGIGIGVRDNRVINYINPAAITARDTLAFMMDFGVTQKNIYNSDSRTRSAYNVFNMQNIAITVPIYKQSAFIIGITPFSNVGYKFLGTEYDNHIEATMGDVKYQKYGTGSINQLFMGAALTFLKRFSFGAQALYYFGALDKMSNALFSTASEYNDIYTGWEYRVSCFSGKFGLQYTQPIAKNQSILTVGITYRMGNDLKGDIYRYAYSASTLAIDTVFYQRQDNLGIKIASEMGIGFSYRQKDKWTIGFDYARQNWKNSTFAEYPGLFNFDPAVAQSFKAGFEIVPNRYDARYYMKKVAYRVGAYYDKSYISLNGHQINSFGITFGASFPVYKWYNAITFAVDLGQRGSLKNDLVRERYVNFMLNINLHDIWFMKYRYE